MTDQPAAAAAPTSRARRPWIIHRLAENPVILKELRGRMRGRPAFVLLTGYLALIGLIIGVLYLTLVQEVSMATWDPEFRQAIGKGIFSTVVLIELFMVSLIGPALTAGAIASERERQTFDILRVTSLSARALVLGKLGASLAYLWLLVFTALPFQSIAFLLGGVGLEEVLISGLLLVITAAFHCTLGIFFSSFMKRTSSASGASYVTIVLSYVVLGLAFLIVTVISTSRFSSYSGGADPLDTIVPVALYFLTCTNPLLAATLSELMLVEDQALFLAPPSFIGHANLYLPSPWITYSLLSVGLMLVLLRLSVRFVQRPDR